MDRGSIDAEIVAGDHEAVYVETETGRQRIERARITDIDHPGDTAIVLGTALSVYGVVNIAVGWKECQRRNDASKGAFCAGVIAPLAIGAPLALYGMAVHSASVNALDTPPGGATARVRVVPVVADSGGAGHRLLVGGAAVASF